MWSTAILEMWHEAGGKKIQQTHTSNLFSLNLIQMPLFGISAVSKNWKSSFIKKTLRLHLTGEGTQQTNTSISSLLIQDPWLHCHTLVLPWSMVPGMGQGLGGQREQGASPKPWCGWDYSRSGSFQITRSQPVSRFSPWDSSVHPPWATPGHVLLIPKSMWGKGYTGYSNQAATYGPCSISTDNINSLSFFHVFSEKKIQLTPPRKQY